MNILIGSVSYYPNISGVAVSTHLLARYLAKKGHNVSVVAPANQLAYYTERDPADQVTVFRIQSIPNPFRKGFFIPVGAKKIVQTIVRQVKPTIVHLQDPTPANVSLARAAQARAIPVIITNHFMLDYVVAYLPKMFAKVAKQYLSKKLVKFYNQCDAVTCPTETVVNLLRHQGVTKPLYAISNGVDIHRFYSYVNLAPVRARFHIPAKPPIVLYVGRIDKDKSMQVLAQAIENVNRTYPTHWVIVGGGDRAKRLQKTLGKAKLTSQVTLTGPIPHDSDELVALYQLASIFVIPSEIETQSIVTMEAMAAGKPIIGARAGALPELIHHHENGLLFPPGDAQAFATMIVRLLKDPEARDRMGQKSLEYIADHELQQSLGLFEQLYHQCLKNHSKNDTS